MKTLVLFLITIYQKYISPYKGFRCAHAVLHKGDSCSAAIRKIIEAHGVFYGWQHIRNRLRSCRNAYQQLSEERERKKDKDKKDKWYDCCDPGLACDAASCVPRKSCDLPDLPCDCSLF